MLLMYPYELVFRPFFLFSPSECVCVPTDSAQPPGKHPTFPSPPHPNFCGRHHRAPTPAEPTHRIRSAGPQPPQPQPELHSSPWRPSPPSRESTAPPPSPPSSSPPRREGGRPPSNPLLRPRPAASRPGPRWACGWAAAGAASWRGGRHGGSLGPPPIRPPAG